MPATHHATSFEGTEMRRAIGIFAMLTFAPLTALAQSSETLGETLFQDGTALVKAGRYEEGCAKLSESQHLDPQLGTLLNLADCHEKAGKTATAWGEYQKLVDLAARADDKERASYAKERVHALDALLAHVTLVVHASIAGVKLDGARLGKSAWGASLPMDPGDHTLDVVDAAGNARTQGFTLPARSSISVDVEAPIALAPAPPPTKPPETNPLRIVGFVMAGAGVALAGAGFGLAGGAIDKKSTVDLHCMGARCDSIGFAAQRDAWALATTGTVFIVAGAVLAVAGVLTAVVAKPRAKALVGAGTTFVWVW